MSDFCFVVFTKPVAGQEAEFNRWYDEQHIPDVVAVPGIVSARRWSAELEDGSTQYLALYNIEADDPDAVLAEINERAGTDRMQMSPALDNDSINAVIYRALGPTYSG